MSLLVVKAKEIIHDLRDRQQQSAADIVQALCDSVILLESINNNYKEMIDTYQKQIALMKTFIEKSNG